MNSYCLRWTMLQKGVAVEHEVRSLILKVAHQLSIQMGIRANPYLPALDIDGVDIRLHLESINGDWAVDIEVSVRSSSKPSVILGREDQYGTLARWLKRSQERRTPCLLFQYDWQTSRMFVFTPNMLRTLGLQRGKKSVSLPNGSSDGEETLFKLLCSIASAASETEARRLLS